MPDYTPNELDWLRVFGVRGLVSASCGTGFSGWMQQTKSQTGVCATQFESGNKLPYSKLSTLADCFSYQHAQHGLKLGRGKWLGQKDHRAGRETVR